MQQLSSEQMVKATAQVVKMRAAVDELQAHVEAACGLFLDSRRGWDRLAAQLEQLVSMEMARGRTRTQALASPLYHGEGTKPTPESVLHASTLGERIDACVSGGFNEVTLSGLCIASIYSMWEDRTRAAIADALDLDSKDEIMSPLFGDIRRMRNALLHAGGRVQTGTPFEVLQWFKKGDVIALTPERFHEIVGHIREFPSGLRTPSWNPFFTAAS